MSKWMTMLKERCISVSAMAAPTKPTEPPFVGFVGSLPGETEKIDQLAAERTNQDAHVSAWMAWQERAAIMEYEGGLSRPEAEAGALQDAIAHWLARHPLTPGVPEDGCIHCAGALPVDYRVAVLAGAGHAWLHPTCMQEMKEARLALAGREVRGLLGFSEAAY